MTLIHANIKNIKILKNTQWSRDYEEDPGFEEDPVMLMWIKKYKIKNHCERGRIKLPIPGYSVRAQRVIVRAG